MKELTKAEEQVMQILWKLGKGFVKDIVEQFPEPKPAYTTVSTIVRILEDKKFIGYKAYGKTHEYYPLIEKSKYGSYTFKNLFKSYFGNSAENLISYFVKENNVSVSELDEILKSIRKNKNTDKK